MTIPVGFSEAATSAGDSVREYGAFKEGAVVFEDVGKGMVRAVGADVLDLVNRLSTNRVDRLGVGEGAPTILTSEKGRIIDLVYVLNMGEWVLLLTGGGAQGKVMEWLDRYTFMEDSALEDVTESMSMLMVAGPTSGEVLGVAAGLELAGLKDYQSMALEVDGAEAWVVRMDVGETPGYQVLVGNGGNPGLLRLLEEQGAVQVGKEGWEAIRVGVGIPVYGKELDESRNPLEAGLIGAIDFAKGCYIGQEVIARLDTYQKVQRALVSLRVTGSWEEGDGLMVEGRKIGEITSLAGARDGGEMVGLGYVRLPDAEVGRRFGGEGDGESWAEVVSVPKLFGG